MEIIVGIISGMVTSTGLGGGTVLILLLTLGLDIPQYMAQATNLIFFIPTSITAIIVNIRNKNIDFKVGTSIALYGVVGSIIGSIVSSKINVQNLRRFFGIFLLCVALHEIYNFYNLYIKTKNTNNKMRQEEEADENEIS